MYVMNEKLKEIRLGLRLNQKDFAARLGIKQSYYNLIENGNRTTPVAVVQKISSEFNISDDWFYNKSTVIRENYLQSKITKDYNKNKFDTESAYMELGDLVFINFLHSRRTLLNIIRLLNENNINYTELLSYDITKDALSLFEDVVKNKLQEFDSKTITFEQYSTIKSSVEAGISLTRLAVCTLFDIYYESTKNPDYFNTLAEEKGNKQE